MPNAYRPFEVGTLIEHLGDLPRERVIDGLDSDADSYRGYYNHVAIAPGRTTVGALLDELKSNVGTTMTGYKGGEYAFAEGCYVFVAPWGDCGPMLIGFTDGDDGSLRPVLCEQPFIY